MNTSRTSSKQIWSQKPEPKFAKQIFQSESILNTNRARTEKETTNNTIKIQIKKPYRRNGIMKRHWFCTSAEKPRGSRRMILLRPLMPLPTSKREWDGGELATVAAELIAPEVVEAEAVAEEDWAFSFSPLMTVCSWVSSSVLVRKFIFSGGQIVRNLYITSPAMYIDFF